VVLPRQPHTGAEGAERADSSPGPEWTNQLATRDTEEVMRLLDDLE
jgi:hypothetical protein